MIKEPSQYVKIFIVKWLIIAGATGMVRIGLWKIDNWLVAKEVEIIFMRNSFFVLITLVFFIGCESSVLDTYNSDPPLKISYSLAVDSYVKLTLENSYNTIVSIIVDAQQSAGTYTININPNGLLEGIYFYTLTAKGINDNSYFEATRRMILINK